ncbi:Cyclin-dependent kinase 1 [Taenia solium]|eukprot:TsM_000332800 transcript=TsM_000332800 gene=TsM_000332800
MCQMLQALRYCHMRRIIYRDLTPQNVSVDVNRSVVKLADLGLPKSFSYPLLSLSGIKIVQVVTLLYRSSEILLGEAVDCCSVDVWSIGCMFVEITMGDPLFCGDSEIDKPFHTFQMKGIPTEATWSDVTNLPYYNPGWVPSWHANRLCSQERIMRALDARNLDLLTSIAVFRNRCNSLTYHFLIFFCNIMPFLRGSASWHVITNPPFRINEQQALLHPYFANLDNRSLPVVGEEYFGLPIGRIPSDFSELFGALITINESKLLRVMSSALSLGASANQVSAARDRFIKGKLEKSETEAPLTENRNVNGSTLRRFIIAVVINLTAHSSPPFHYANYWLAPGTVTIIAVLVVQ